MYYVDHYRVRITPTPHKKTTHTTIHVLLAILPTHLPNPTHPKYRLRFAPPLSMYDRLLVYTLHY